MLVNIIVLRIDNLAKSQMKDKICNTKIKRTVFHRSLCHPVQKNLIGELQKFRITVFDRPLCYSV